jgi:hypothetical protein
MVKKKRLDPVIIRKKVMIVKQICFEFDARMAVKDL